MRLETHSSHSSPIRKRGTYIDVLQHEMSTCAHRHCTIPKEPQLLARGKIQHNASVLVPIVANKTKDLDYPRGN